MAYLPCLAAAPGSRGGPALPRGGPPRPAHAGLAFVLCLLPFVVGLRSVLGAAEGGPQIGSRLVLIGGVATVIVGDAATAFLDALALGGADDFSDATIRLLLQLDAVAIAAIGLPMALTVIAAATVIWRTGVLPRWLAAVAALSGLLHIVGASFVAADDADGPLFFTRFAGLIAFAVFVAASSVTLIRGIPPAPTPRPRVIGDQPPEIEPTAPLRPE